MSAFAPPAALLRLGNVWDVPSARALERAGYAALGTSSAAVAAQFGYADGERMPFTLLCEVTRAICTAVSVPVSVDAEGGYARDPDAVAANVLRLVRHGAAGVNLEDSRVCEGGRAQGSPAAFAEMLRAVRGALDGAGLTCFVNARSDAYLLGADDALAQTLARGRAYAEAGADGLFVPGLTAEVDIARVVAEVALPLNVLALPGLPPPRRLEALGVARLSTGNFAHDALQRRFGAFAKTLHAAPDYAALFRAED